MSSQENKKLNEISALTLKKFKDSCLKSSEQIQTAFATAQGNKTLSNLEKVYEAIKTATPHFLAVQKAARSQDQATAQEILKILSDSPLDDILKKVSSLTNELCDEQDRNNILRDARYARTQAMDESDETLKELRALTSSSNPTPAESKARLSTTEPKPDIKRTESIATAAEARAALQREKTARLAERAAEIKAAKARIDAAHEQAIQLLAQVKVADAKEQQPDQAADAAKAKTLAETCATLFKELAEAPFTGPELALEDIHDLMRKVIAKFLELQPLLRTFSNKAQAQTLLDAAAAQKEELTTIDQYMRERNLRISADDNIEFLCSKLIHATNTRLGGEVYKNAEDTETAIRVEERHLLKKVTTLFIACQTWLKELREIPERKPEVPVPAIHAILKEATADFITLQREARRLNDTEHAKSILANIEANDISNFLSHIKTLNQQTYDKEDPNNLLADFLRFKNTPFSEPMPQLEKPAEQKASVLQEGFMLEVTQVKTARSNHEKIKQERMALIEQLTSEPTLKDIIANIRSIVAKTIGMKGASEKTTLQGNEKEQLQILVKDILKTDYLKSIEPLLKEKFPEQAGVLLEALRENKIDGLQPLLEQPSKPDQKEAKKKSGGGKSSFWNKFSKSAANLGGAPLNPADSVAKNAADLGASNNVSKK